MNNFSTLMLWISAMERDYHKYAAYKNPQAMDRVLRALRDICELAGKIELEIRITERRLRETRKHDQ